MQNLLQWNSGVSMLVGAIFVKSIMIVIFIIIN